MTATRYYRKIIKIKAEDSPNVQRELLRQQGVPEAELPAEVPGVLSWGLYQKRRATWDAVRQCIGLDAEFWEGADTFLFPPDWLNRSEHAARTLAGKPRTAVAGGCDPAEGGDHTAFAAVDEHGLIELASEKTPDTSVVVGKCIAFMKRHGIPPDRFCIDAGGGGKEHADRLRALGYKVRTVAFGESVTPEPRKGTARVIEKIDNREERYAYFNRRAQMYHELRLLLDPSNPDRAAPFALPPQYVELRRQLAPIPLTYTEEGRIKLLPKNRRSADGKEKCLTELIGCSPDEADAVVLAVHGMLHRQQKIRLGGING